LKKDATGPERAPGAKVALQPQRIKRSRGQGKPEARKKGRVNFKEALEAGRLKRPPRKKLTFTAHWCIILA